MSDRAYDSLLFLSFSGPERMDDVRDHLTALKVRGIETVVLSPIGFLSDHMEVAYDLDTEARQHGQEIGIDIIRAATAGTHPAFLSMARELVLERTEGRERRALGKGGPGDIVRKSTGHRSRELERYQHLSPLFRAQTVDLIAQVLLSDTPTDTPAPEEEQDDANLFENGGVDGTRTRDLRRDRPAF